MRFLKRWWGFVVVGIMMIGFVSAGINRLDPDFGWHWRMGKIISERGIVKLDILSYTMPSYEFIDFHWLSNLLMYKGYELFGMTGLGVVYALMAMLALRLVLPKKISSWGILAMALAAVILYPRMGVRPQVESWLLFAITLSWYRNQKVWMKTRVLFPLLTIVWVNLHGGFFLAWGVVGVGVIVNLIKEKKWLWGDVVVLGLGIGASLVNPYGTKMWLAIINLVFDPITRANILEWLPFYWNIEPVMFFMGVLIIGLGGKRLVKSETVQVVLGGGLFLGALSSLRNAPFFVLAAIPLVVGAVETFFDQVANKGEEAVRRGKLFNRVLQIVVIGVFIVFSGISIMIDAKKQQGEENFYPKRAVEFFKAKNYQGNVFTTYEWAGYMEWKWEEKKQFVDGRMPEWKQPQFSFLGQKRSEVFTSESENAFVDYIRIRDGGEFKEVFRTYNIEVVIIPVEIQETEKEKKNNLWLQKLLGKNKPDIKNFYEEIEKEGWKKVYEDKVAWGYVKSD